MDDDLDTARMDQRLNVIHQQYLTEQMNNAKEMIRLHEYELLIMWGVVLACLAGITINSLTIRKLVRELELKEKV